MNTLSLPGLWPLARDEVARLDDACGTRLEAAEGTLWITQDGVQEDVVLERGESFVVPSHARTLVQALRGPGLLLTRRVGGCAQPTRTWLERAAALLA